VIVRKTKFKLKSSIETSKYSAIHEIYESLINNSERNHMIISDIVEAITKNRFPVILTERKEHLEVLKLLLENKIEYLIIMKGGMGKKQRLAAIKDLEHAPNNAKKAILATGRYLGEGFDENRLDTLFLTLPISWRGTLAQYAGRLHRSHDTKNEVQIFDYADLEVPMLAKMYKRRLIGYRAIGYKIEG
jgi:superfamily II DNA or RNA helicase